jgi:hypothetical protein
MSVKASTVFGQAQNIENFARRDYFEGVPYEEVTLLDSATAVPILLKMLEDPDEEEYWPNAVVILGMLGDEQAVDPLIRFLEQSKTNNLSHDHYNAKTLVLMALGYLVNKSGNHKALAYLKDGVKPVIWSRRNLNWKSPYHDGNGDRNIRLSEMAIIGLALSGDPSAADTLRSLEEPAATELDRRFQAKASDLVSEAISAHETISREGLATYDRRARGE